MFINQLYLLLKVCYVCLPPISMTQIEKIFSASVLADTFPKPTLVKLLRVKYSDAMYTLRIEGPLVVPLTSAMA